MSQLLLLLGSLMIVDVSGVVRQPLKVGAGKANVLFFITTDCPISNSYAPEIARICADYKSKGVSCALVYVDPSTSDQQASQHATEYRHGDYPRIVDRRHELVKATGATITPEAAIIDHAGNVVYLGRIDDSYASLGQPRRPRKLADLRNALDAVLIGRRVAIPRTRALGCYISDLSAQNKP